MVKSAIRPAAIADAQAMADIYNYYVLNTPVTFEEEALSREAMEDRIRSFTSLYPWFVWEEDGEIAAYAYAHMWHERTAYRHSVEDTVYVKQGFQRRGIGRTLLGMVVGELKKQGVHAVMAVIAIPNEGSAALHESLGFKKVGHFSEIGRKMGRWRDVGYWELIIDESHEGDLP
ncbi:MAG: GNAT family N-acetyltransferase [Treponema sp.]|jgi:phosphinothricin acetyltransferase|nr:GNAT family N-acetyltransferase [Treponema sp.]